jgi:hypothetical protein
MAIPEIRPSPIKKRRSADFAAHCEDLLREMELQKASAQEMIKTAREMRDSRRRDG